MQADIDIALIDEAGRLRKLSEAQVVAIMDSVADIGLLNPITVHATKVFRGASCVDGYGLIAGAHRLEAFRRLGLVEIPAHVVDLGELERQIAECDENLCGTKLTPSEKAMFTKRRKSAYEALHPETRHEVFKGNQHASRQIGDKQPADRFTSDTASKTGESERVVQRNAERGERISAKALELVHGTDLDKGVYLDKLKAVPVGEQVRQVKADLEQRKASNINRRVKRADAPLDDEDACEKQLAALMNAWNRAGREARQRFLETIDVPVMDAAQ